MSGDRRSASSSVDCKEAAPVTAAAATNTTTAAAAAAVATASSIKEMSSNVNNGIGRFSSPLPNRPSLHSESGQLHYEETPNHSVYRKVSFFFFFFFNLLIRQRRRWRTLLN